MQMDLPPIKGIKKELDTVEYEDFKCNILDEHFNVQIKVQSRTSIVFEDDEFNLWRKCEAGEDLIEYDDIKKLIKQECSRCHKILENTYALLRHNLQHMKICLSSCLEEYKYKCEVCTAHYNNRKDLNTHYFNEHEINTNTVTNQNRECGICKKFFTYKIWHSHMREVHGNRRICCDICQKTFKCWRYLRNHLNRHKGVTSIKTEHRSPAKCDQCPAVLKHKSALTTHKKNCHSDETFVCKICNSKLKSHPYLITHMKRVHYDDGKEYRCECGKSFRSPRYLTVHKRNSHH